MASEADSSFSHSGAGKRSTAAAVVARQDRIPTWSLSYLFIGIIGVGILVIAPLIPTLLASLGSTTGPIVIFLIIDAFLVVAAIVAQFGPATRRKRLDEVSP